MATRVETLHAGDELPAASDAVAEVEHFDGSLTRLDAGAVAQLGRLADPDGRPHVVITLGVGDSWHRTSGESARHGQYEAHTPSAVAMARDAVFVVRSRADGTAWFAVLTGTVVVRGHAGGTAVLHGGEAVTATASGAMGDVDRAGVDRLAHDDWVALNALLDTPPTTEAGDADVDADAETPPPAIEPAPTTEPDLPTADRDHPWRIGVAAVLAIGLGIFSVIIGRSASTPRKADPERSPGIAVPGPPAFSSPALTTPAPATPPAAATPPAQLPETDLAEPTPAGLAPTALRYDVTGRTCSRRAGAVHYTGSIRNEDDVARDYTVQVRFVDRSGTTVAEASTAVNDVPAGGIRSFRVTGAGSGVRLATDCEVGTVEVG